MKKKLYKDLFAMVKEALPKFFPNRQLEVVKDGNLYKIIGDFSLGELQD